MIPPAIDQRIFDPLFTRQLCHTPIPRQQFKHHPGLELRVVFPPFLIHFLDSFSCRYFLLAGSPVFRTHYRLNGSCHIIRER